MIKDYCTLVYNGVAHMDNFNTIGVMQEHTKILYRWANM